MLAARLAAIQPFVVMEIQRRAFELARAGRSIIHLEIGQPDFGAAPSVVAQAQKVLARDPLRYTESLGIPALRERIARWYHDRYAVPVSPEQIIVTTGASGAFALLCGALVGPGDQVLMPDPCYPCNRHFVRMFEGEARLIPVDESSAYQPTADLVEQHWTPQTRGVMLASPSNPTGTCIELDALRAISTVARARGGFTIVDEIYQGLTYGREGETALQVAPDAIIVNSFSKYFAMTGWRIGWIVAPQPLVAAIERLAQNAFICPPALAQHAALAAMAPEAVAVHEARRGEFHARRDYLVPALRALGFGIPVLPSGAFYIYADASRFGDDANLLAREILEVASVAVTPGLDFGLHRANRYLRFAYTRSMDDLREGVQRLRRFLNSR